MPVWATVVIIAVLAIALVVAIYLLVRRPGTSASVQGDLAASTEKRLKDELDAERIKTAAVAMELKKLTEAHRKLTTWYNDAMGKIDKETQDAFNALAVDPDAVDRKLDALLGRPSTADPKDPPGEG